jgi:4-amino-4-deoxy-L-arabinose transferase-like glycosyltransferase
MVAQRVSSLRESQSRTVLLLILLAAAFLRLWQLDSVPPGLTHDEANNVHDAAAVLDGVRPMHFPVAQGKEPLYPYSVAALMAVLGRSPWTMRLTSALWGLLVVVLSYAWTRRAFGPVIASLTAAGLAVGFWPVSTSHMGLRAITLPALFAVAVYCLWRALDAPWGLESPGRPSNRSAATGANSPERDGMRLTIGRSSAFYALAGLALGGSLYTYLAARLMPLALGLFFIYLYLWHRKIAWGLLLTLAVAALVAAPLFLYLHAHPSAEIRIGQLDRPVNALLEGDPGPLLARIGETLPMLSFHGDTFIPYNLPGKPLLGPVMSVLFYAGLALAVWRWRQPAYALALLWLVTGLAPALVTGIEAVNLRAIAAQPVVYLFPALSLHAIGQRLRGLVRSRGVLAQTSARNDPFKRLAVLGGIALFAAVAVLTYRDYFLRWAHDRDVRVHYHADLVAVADYVRGHPGETFVISALYPGQYHDPRVVEAVLGRDDPHLRWVDGRGALVLPGQDADSAVTFVVPATTPLDPALSAALAPNLISAGRITVQPDDFNPYFDVYRWQGHNAPLNLPSIQIGAALHFLSADVRTAQAGEGPASLGPGDTVQVLTLWQIATPPPTDRDAVLFVQVLGSDGRVVAQRDHLDAPSWNWHADDQFAQLFRIPLPADLAPGSYRLIAGVYTTPDRVDAVLTGHEPDPALPRLPVQVDGQVIGDFVELPTLEVIADE